MSGHTPGPLVVEDLSLGDKVIVDTTADYAGIGEAYSQDGISGGVLPAQANATLWAAASDLLAACEAEEESERLNSLIPSALDKDYGAAHYRWITKKREAKRLRLAAIAKTKDSE